MGMHATVCLPSGLTIEDPQCTLAGYYTGNSVVHYDQAAVLEDGILVLDDILISRKIASRIGDATATCLLTKAAEIRPLLEVIDIDLVANEVPWYSVAHLVQVCCGVPGVKLARTTKILHKKRPSFFPLIDSVLEKAYKNSPAGAADEWPSLAHYAERAVLVMRLMRRDLISASGRIEALRAWLAGPPMEIGVTGLRVLDALIWSKYSQRC